MMSRDGRNAAAAEQKQKNGNLGSAPLTASWRVQKVSTNPYFYDTTFPPLFIPDPNQPPSPLAGACKGAAPSPPHPNERTRGAQLVARAADGGSEHEKRLASPGLVLGLGLGLSLGLWGQA